MEFPKLFFIIALATSLLACDNRPAHTSPATVKFSSAALYPEGIAWDAADQRFLVTSLRKGEIGSVADDGSYTVFATSPHMVSSIGIKIDARRDRVLVCNSDPGAGEKTSKATAGKLAGLAAFHLSTGQLIKYIDLDHGMEGGHFCNDLTIAEDGTAYVTDSFSPIIYKVDTNYNSSVLINNPAFSGKSFNLNGIVVKDNYLLAVKMNSGQLFKIPLDNPNTFTEVKLENPVYAADGMEWAQDGSLYIIANNNAYVGAEPPTVTNKVFKLTSTDNWASARIVGQADTGDVFATTGTLRDGKLYVIHAMLHVLFNPETKKHLEQFEIRAYNP